MRTYLKFDGKSIACGSIDPLPGCSQMAVFHSAFVLPQYRGTGHSLKAHYERPHTAKEALYDAAVCTVDSSNKGQIRILENYGWKCVHTFNSSKTGHDVQMWVKNL